MIAAALDMGADLIVLDTLARTFGDGDENAARDMGGFVASVDRLRAETGAHVAVIHHGTKEGGSSRGSGALLGAADLIEKVTKDAGGGPNLAAVEAAKDEADGAALAFRLRVVELVPRPDGTTRTTCVAEEAAGSGHRAKPLPRLARDALCYLAGLILTEDAPLPAGPLFPPGIMGVPETRWREECETRRLSMAEKEGDRALPGNPYDGHTLAAQIAQTERLTGVAIERAYVDRGYRGHDADEARVVLSGQKRGVTPAIRRGMRRRNAIEPVISHAESDGHLGRNFLRGTAGDAINAILAAAGHNLRLLRSWLTWLLASLFALPLAACQTATPHPMRPAAA